MVYHHQTGTMFILECPRVPSWAHCCFPSLWWSTPSCWALFHKSPYRRYHYPVLLSTHLPFNRDLLGSDLVCVAKWIEDNGLKINVSKTQLLVLSPPRREEHAKTIKLCLKGEETVQQEKVKYLGVIVDNNCKLNWKPHILNLRRKCLAGLAFLRHYGNHLPVNSRKLLYQSFILSQLELTTVQSYMTPAVKPSVTR